MVSYGYASGSHKILINIGNVTLWNLLNLITSEYSCEMFSLRSSKDSSVNSKTITFYLCLVCALASSFGHILCMNLDFVLKVLFLKTCGDSWHNCSFTQVSELFFSQLKFRFKMDDSIFVELRGS